MKKVLRHFRKNWIRYGFETLVVIVGVLIAFSLNDWNEERKEQKRILLYYQELRDDLNNDLTNINMAINTVKETEKLGLYIYDFITNQLEGVDSAKLKMAFISTERYAFFSRSKNAYSNLLSSGDIHLVSNKKIKKRLGNYHDDGQWLWSVHNSKLKQTVEAYGRYIHHFTHPLLVRNFYARTFEFVEIDSLDSVVPYETLPIDWDKVRADSGYLTLLSDVMAQRVFQLSFYGSLRSEIQELLLLLNSEIERIQ